MSIKNKCFWNTNEWTPWWITWNISFHFLKDSIEQTFCFVNRKLEHLFLFMILTKNIVCQLNSFFSIPSLYSFRNIMNIYFCINNSQDRHINFTFWSSLHRIYKTNCRSKHEKQLYSSLPPVNHSLSARRLPWWKRTGNAFCRSNCSWIYDWILIIASIHM